MIAVNPLTSYRPGPRQFAIRRPRCLHRKPNRHPRNRPDSPPARFPSRRPNPTSRAPFRAPHGPQAAKRRAGHWSRSVRSAWVTENACSTRWLATAQWSSARPSISSN